jgi:hypothetical protein
MVDELENKVFPIPEKLLNILNKIYETYSDRTTLEGYKRLKNLLNNPKCTGIHLKRIKNYFDTVDPNNLDQIEYLLNGGDYMKRWVTKTLDQARANIEGTKIHKTNAGLENQFRSAPSDEFNPDSVMPSKIRNYPADVMNPKLMEQINKIKDIINKID